MISKNHVSKNKYKEVFDIDSRWLIKIAAYRGKWIDQSQSLNIFYKGTSGSELSEIYNYAWEMGLKTTYYLRTLAASTVEKSTVSLSKQNVQSSIDSKISAPLNVSVAEMVAQVREEVRVEVQPKGSMNDSLSLSSEIQIKTTTEKIITPNSGLNSDGIKLCKLEDPDCESCQ